MNRDRDIVFHILRYCEEIEQAAARFGDNKALFMEDAVYRNAVSMPVQQIGELAKHLTEEFIALHADIPWKQIKGMRTWFAHQYLNMDAEVIWDVVQHGIPPLQSFCKEYFGEK